MTNDRIEEIRERVDIWKRGEPVCDNCEDEVGFIFMTYIAYLLSEIDRLKKEVW